MLVLAKSCTVTLVKVRVLAKQSCKAHDVIFTLDQVMALDQINTTSFITRRGFNTQSYNAVFGAQLQVLPQTMTSILLLRNYDLDIHL